jgi:hypothetical protein
MGGACGTHGGEVYTRFCWRELMGMKPLGGLRYRWEDNIKMGPTEIRWENIDWSDLA